MIPEWTDATKRGPEDVAALVRSVSDSLVRYSFGLVGEVNAAEEIALKAIADYVYRNETRRLPRTYLWRTAYTHAVDYLRKKRRELSLSGWEDVLSTEGDPVAEAAEAVERRRILYRALAAIAPDYRHAVYLCYLEGFSVEETADVMHKNAKQIYNLLSRAKVALKTWFDKEGIRYEDL